MEVQVDMLDEVDLMEAQPSVDEILARWKARADAYQYDPNKKHRYYSLEEFGEMLRAAVREQL
ncbi:MAG: hypothetical protein IJT39_01480 [Bacteroidales bacterium]|nr:hypothetical protein [Bacteroidales bacterium]